MSRVTVLGWKQNKLPDYIKLCEDLCYELAKRDFSIVHGGGGGFMEAAARGAYKFDKHKSIAFNVKNLNENGNDYVLNEHKFVCDTFSIRIGMLLDTSDFLIFMPGNIGTLSEWTFALNDFKTLHKKIKPIICVGVKFWTTLRDWFIMNGLEFPDNYVSLISDDKNEILDFIDKTRNNDLL